MSYLYVHDQGAEISVDGGCFVITQRDGLKKKIPSEMLEYVALFGDIQITTQALRQFMKNDIIISFFSNNGSYYGKLESTTSTKIARQRIQFKLSGDTKFSIELSRKIISAKIHNQAVMLRRYTYGKGNFEDQFMHIKNSQDNVMSAETINEIMGYEGIAARYYFEVLSDVVDADFSFNGRNRQPPKDAFNSMLSFGYTLLMHEVYGAIIGKGLNPYAGFLHQDSENHPTLASDLMEEWRAVLIDSLVMSLIQGHEVSIDNFTPDYETGGIMLDKTSFSTFIKKYEKKMKTETHYLDYVDYGTSFRTAIYLQINNLVKALEQEDADIYSPVKLR